MLLTPVHGCGQLWQLMCRRLCSSNHKPKHDLHVIMQSSCILHAIMALECYAASKPHHRGVCMLNLFACSSLEFWIVCNLVNWFFCRLMPRVYCFCSMPVLLCSYVIAIVLAPLFQSLVENQMQYQLNILGLKMRNGLMAAIYRKCLRLSNAALQSESTGKVVTLMSNDAQKVRTAAAILFQCRSLIDVSTT